MSTGLQAQLGFKSETTVGTGVTVDQFHAGFLSEQLRQEIERLESAGLRAGRRTRTCRKPATVSIGGRIELELFHTPLATLLKHMMGSIATTGTDPYTHTATPGSLVGDALTIQIGRPAADGTVHPFTYAGCKIGEWTIAADVGEIARLTLDIVGMSETTGTALASASYASGACPFVFTEASLTVAGGAVNTVRSLEVSGSNAVEDRVRLGSANSVEPVENGWREYGGRVVTDFEDLTAYNRFVNGTEAALVALFDNGTETLTVTTNVMFDGETPSVSGPEMLEQPLPFVCLSDTSDAAAITLELVNSESTA